jgi:hypothetical protein
MTSACEAMTRVLPGAAVIELSGEVDGSAAAVLTDAYERAVTAARPIWARSSSTSPRWITSIPPVSR